MLRDKILVEKLLAYMLLAVLVILPGNASSFIGGLPLTNTQMLIICVVIIGIFFSKSPDKIRWLNIFTILLVLTHIVGYLFLPVGWNVCVYRLNGREPITNKCEKTVRFKDGTRTALPSSINYENKNFPLYFMNDEAFNYYPGDEWDRDHLPYRMTMEGYQYSTGVNSLLLDTSIPGVRVSINGDDKEIKIGVNSLSLMPGTNKINVTYETKRNDSDKISISNEPVTFFKPVGLITRIFVIPFWLLEKTFVVLALLAFMRLIFSEFVKLNNKDKKIYFFIALGLFLVYLCSEYLKNIGKIEVGVFAASLNFLGSDVKMRVLESLGVLLSFAIFPLYFVITQWKIFTAKLSGTLWHYLLIIFFCFTFALAFIKPESTIILAGGNDPRTHEDFSRQVALATDLRSFLTAGEKTVFYYQPMYRYLVGVIHLLFGDSIFAPVFVQLLVASLLIVSLYSLLGKYPKVFRIIFIILFCPLLMIEYTSIFGIALTTMQQALAIPLFLISIILLFGVNKETERNYLIIPLAGVLLGFSLATRTDFLPGILGFLYILFNKISFVKNKKGTITIFAIGLIAPFLFIGFRNAFVAGQFQLIPSSGGVNLLGQFNEFLHISGPTHQGALSLYGKIIKHYAHTPMELINILGVNIMQGFIGYHPWRKFIWYFAFNLLLIYGLLRRPGKSEELKAVMSTVFILVPLILANSFYVVHNGFGMLIQYDFLIILVIVYCLIDIYHGIDLSTLRFNDLKKNV